MTLRLGLILYQTQGVWPNWGGATGPGDTQLQGERPVTILHLDWVNVIR